METHRDLQSRSHRFTSTQAVFFTVWSQ